MGLIKSSKSSKNSKSLRAQKTMGRLCFGFVLGFGFCLNGWSAAPEGELVSMVICKSPGIVSSSQASGKAVRTLRLYSQGEETGCVATYSKTNIERTVGSSRIAGQCRSILEGIQKNLESSQWACKHAASAKIMKSKLAAENEKALREAESESQLEKEL
jgi:hypothetical protein